MKTVYLAGPMRGYEHYNFPAFDVASERLRDLGYKVFSPADMDREHGFDPILNPEQGCPLTIDCAQRDIDAIFKCDSVVLLPGWEKSAGANAEIAVARWIEKPVHEIGDFITKHFFSQKQYA
jgi:nucleoside 2-deoxyribosyltransferase